MRSLKIIPRMMIVFVGISTPVYYVSINNSYYEKTSVI